MQIKFCKKIPETSRAFEFWNSNLKFKTESSHRAALRLRPAVVVLLEAHGAPAGLPPELAGADIHRAALRRRPAVLAPPEASGAPAARARGRAGRAGG